MGLAMVDPPRRSLSAVVALDGLNNNASCGQLLIRPKFAALSLEFIKMGQPLRVRSHPLN